MVQGRPTGLLCCLVQCCTPESIVALGRLPGVGIGPLRIFGRDQNEKGRRQTDRPRIF